MRVFTEYLWFTTSARQEFIRITDDVARIVEQSGVREGMVRIEGFGPKLSPAVRQEVSARQTELAQGRLKIFKGPLLDERGQMVLPAGQVMTDAQIKGMNFKVQGVRSM